MWCYFQRFHIYSVTGFSIIIDLILPFYWLILQRFGFCIPGMNITIHFDTRRTSKVDLNNRLWHKQLMIELKLLLLIIIANGTPVLARNIFKSHFETALDFNRMFFDGRPVFGPTKTWRGIIVAIVITVPFALLLGFTAELGLVLAALAMVGDLLGSFIKRRLKLAPSSRALGLDQIPESLLPMFACQGLLGLSWQSTVMVVFLFFVMELLLSRLLYQLHIRKHPY